MFQHGYNPNNLNPNELNPNGIFSNNYNHHSYSPDHPIKTRGYIKSHSRSPDDIKNSKSSFKLTSLLEKVLLGLLIYIII